MPCNSDYLNPTDKERKLQRTAQLFVYVLEQTGNEVSADLRKTAETMYAKDDYVPDLCSFLKGLDEADRDAIVYNAKSKVSRELADWWEEHLEADAKNDEESYKPRFKWEYCECGCHGSELSIGNFYRWSIVDFPKGVQNPERIHHLNDGHKWGQHLGSFKTFKELEDRVAQELEGQIGKLAAAIGKKLV